MTQRREPLASGLHVPCGQFASVQHASVHFFEPAVSQSSDAQSSFDVHAVPNALLPLPDTPAHQSD